MSPLLPAPLLVGPLITATLITAPARAEPAACRGAAPTAAEIREASLAALTAATVLERDEAVALTTAVEAMVPCAGEVLPAPDVALLHRAAAVRDYLEGDLAGALQGLQASRALDPEARLPAGLLATRDGLVAMYDTAARAPVYDPETLLPPTGTQVHVDGAPSEVRSRSVPTVVQYADARGRVYWSRRIDAGAALPEDIPVQPPSTGALFRDAWNRARGGLFVEGVGGVFGSGEVATTYTARHYLDASVLDPSSSGASCAWHDCHTSYRLVSGYGLSPGATLRAGTGADGLLQPMVELGGYGIRMARDEEWALVEGLGDSEDSEVVATGEARPEPYEAPWPVVPVLAVGPALRLTLPGGRLRPFAGVRSRLHVPLATDRPFLIYIDHDGEEYLYLPGDSLEAGQRLLLKPGIELGGGLGAAWGLGPTLALVGSADVSWVGSLRQWRGSVTSYAADLPDVLGDPGPDRGPFGIPALSAQLGVQWRPWGRQSER